MADALAEQEPSSGGVGRERSSPERYAFEPDAARARSLDATMHAALGDSLDYLSGVAADAGVVVGGPAIAALVGRLHDGRRHGVAAFAHYYDLIPALQDGDAASAERLFAKLAQLSAHEAPLDVWSIGDPRLGEIVASLRAKLDTDPDTPFAFLDPPDELIEPFRRRFFDGLALLERTLPDLAGEVRGIIGRVLLAVGPEGARYVFDGGSSYMLWGMLALNARFHQTRVQMAEVIAHESAHVLLFGFAIDEPLTLNPDDERYPSPLRVDLRPMDGIYHATFVSARMHWVMTRLAASGELDAEECAEALAAAAADAANFASGHATIAAHGALSPAGAALMANAKAYMDRAAGA